MTGSQPPTFFLSRRKGSSSFSSLRSQHQRCSEWRGCGCESTQKGNGQPSPSTDRECAQLYRSRHLFSFPHPSSRPQAMRPSAILLVATTFLAGVATALKVPQSSTLAGSSLVQRASFSRSISLVVLLPANDGPLRRRRGELASSTGALHDCHRLPKSPLAFRRRLHPERLRNRYALFLLPMQ